MNFLHRFTPGSGEIFYDDNYENDANKRINEERSRQCKSVFQENKRLSRDVERKISQKTTQARNKRTQLKKKSLKSFSIERLNCLTLFGVSSPAKLHGYVPTPRPMPSMYKEKRVRGIVVLKFFLLKHLRLGIANLNCTWWLIEHPNVVMLSQTAKVMLQTPRISLWTFVLLHEKITNLDLRMTVP